MRLGLAAEELRAASHEVDWPGNWPEDPGDDAILARAHAEERLLVTLDKDFGKLAIVHGRPHHGIVRLVNFCARQQAPACLAVLEAHGDELLSGPIGYRRARQNADQASSWCQAVIP